MKRKFNHDKRVKTKIFPISIFIFTVLGFAMFTTGQMYIINEYIDISRIPLAHAVSMVIMWIIAAMSFTIMTAYQIDKRYQKPIEEFAQVTRKVASGDFSVFIEPKHTPNKFDYLDVIFMDFNKMVEELGSVETLRIDFFSNVSHEIKTPLAIIQNNAELLHRDGIMDKRCKEYTENILHATKRLSNLITNMLKLNKLEKQVITPEPKYFDLCIQLCECALQFEDMWDKKDIEFVAEMEDYAMLRADEGLLELVWTNLLSNAMKFTSDGGTITIIQTSNKKEITVCISDTGCGMNEETIKHIFDKFYQGDTSHATEGNGLGLALVWRIIQLSEGTITVESTLGKGTTFTIRLPRNLEKEDD